MGLRAGLLREQVAILRPVVSRNDFGEESTEWVKVTDTRARVDFRSGNRVVSVNEVTNPYTVTFVLRRFVEIEPNFRLAWRGRQYTIESVNSDPAHQQQTLICEVINE